MEGTLTHKPTQPVSGLQSTPSDLRPRFRPGRTFAPAALVVAGCSLLIALGCGLPGQQVVARVDSHSLTLKQFEKLLRDASAGVTAPDSLHRRMLVDDWIDQTLLLADAEGQHLDSLPAVQTALRQQLEVALVNEYYQREIVSKVKVDPDDARKLYERRKQSVVLARILLATKPEAEALKKELDKGASFEQAAMQHSMDRNTAINGGLAGEANAGELPHEIEEVVFALKKGEVGGPVHSQFGYDLIKVVDFKPHKQGTFEEEKTRLEASIRRQKEYDATLAALDKLKLDHKFTMDENGLSTLVTKMQKASVVADTIPPFSPAELMTPLARYIGGPYTVGQFMDQVRQSRADSRPNLTNPQEVRQFAENRAGQALLAGEARSHGLDKDPEIRAGYDERRSGILARTLVSRLIQSLPPTTDADLQREFEAHRHEFVNQGTAEVLYISTADPKGAEEAAREARANIDFAGLQRRYSRPLPEEVHEGGATRLYIDGTNPALDDSLHSAKMGAVVGPVGRQGRLYVYQVRNVFPAMNLTFDQARSTLEQRAHVEAENKILRDHLATLKKRWPPEIHEATMLHAKPAAAAKTATGNG
jgi:parvulin-like peptidyl-prolyl isomerase